MEITGLTEPSRARGDSWSRTDLAAMMAHLRGRELEQWMAAVDSDELPALHQMFGRASPDLLRKRILLGD